MSIRHPETLLLPAMMVVAFACGFTVPGVAAPEASDASVTTTILPDSFPNVPPVPVPRSLVVESDRAGLSPSVLLGVFDVEMDRVSVGGVMQPAHGHVQQEADGRFHYEPTTGFVGRDAFDYVITDDRGGRATGRVNVQVTPADRPITTTRFSGLSPINIAGDAPTDGNPTPNGGGSVVPRLSDLDGDGLIDLVVACQGLVSWRRNVGRNDAPVFAASTPLMTDEEPIRLAGRLAMTLADIDGDRVNDLVVAAEPDRELRWH
ncbi:MAG: Ig-like domain-containing protein, partial [Planctomycetaceae bacterium]